MTAHEGLGHGKEPADRVVLLKRRIAAEGGLIREHVVQLTALPVELGSLGGILLHTLAIDVAPSQETAAHGRLVPQVRRVPGG